MWPLPFLFFTASGRAAMGLRKVERPAWLGRALLIGAASALLIFELGYELYGKGPANWYVSIRNSWAIDPATAGLPRGQLFLIYTLPAILFSPVGEEFFFRG